MTRSFIVAVVLFGAAAAATVLGCEDDEKVLVGEGSPCASIVDCQAGLSCVATSGTDRVCKMASTPVPVTPEVDATTEDAGQDAIAAPDADPDAGDPDASAPEGGDATLPVDAADAAITDAADGG